jgi:hypothetical protein
MFLQNVHVENFLQKIDQKIHVSFPRLCLGLFIVFSGVSQRREFKNTTKNVLQKIVSKCFYKKIDKKSKTDLLLDLCYHVFGRFSARGVQKHHPKYIENISLLGL